MTFLILFISTICFSQESKLKEIAITFDDSPRFASGFYSGPERAIKLISALKKHNVKQVAFFSNSKKLNEEGIRRIKLYNKANHLIANHSHSHPNFNKTSLDIYAKDILKADSILKQFSHFTKYYRFPYLREGDTIHKRDGIRSLLKKHHYILQIPLGVLQQMQYQKLIV